MVILSGFYWEVWAKMGNLSPVFSRFPPLGNHGGIMGTYQEQICDRDWGDRDTHGIKMGVSENVVYPFLPNGFADHYPYFLWLFHWEYTQHFQTNPYVGCNGMEFMGEFGHFMGIKCEQCSRNGSPMVSEIVDLAFFHGRFDGNIMGIYGDDLGMAQPS